MKSCDLTTGLGKLELAIKSLRVTMHAVDAQWIDETHRKYQENHLSSIDPSVKRMFDAVSRIGEAIAACERQCDSD